jgi:hypothetical protein
MAKLEFLSKVQGLPAIINIKIKKIFEEKTDNYGKIKKCCVVDYNGTEYYVDFKSKDWNLLSEGAVLSAVKKLYDGNPYFEFYAGSTNAEAHSAVHTPIQPEIKREMAQDATQERILKGMCFNNACTLLGVQAGYTDGQVLSVAKALYNEMKEWLIS